MMSGVGDETLAAPVVTFVLRIWHVGGTRGPRAFRCQTIHVQTGDVAYHRTLESVMHHIQRLADQPRRNSPTPLFPDPRDSA